MIFLRISTAASISDMHQPDASQSGETSASTTSQRWAAFCKASFQRWPALMPRSGSRSRKTSVQPFAASQSRTSMALSLLALEWLIKSFAMSVPPYSEIRLI